MLKKTELQLKKLYFIPNNLNIPKILGIILGVFTQKKKTIIIYQCMTAMGKEKWTEK